MRKHHVPRFDYAAIAATARVMVERGMTGRGCIEARLDKWGDKEAVWAVIHEVQRITSAGKTPSTEARTEKQEATEQVIRDAIFAIKPGMTNIRTYASISISDSHELARRIHDALQNGGYLADLRQ